MFFIVSSGFIISILMLFAGRYLKSRWSMLLSLFPLASFVYFLLNIPVIKDGNAIFERFSWIPSLGINADFRLDGLSLLFSLLITGIGVFILLYASAYLHGHKYIDRFFGYLCLFMSSMLGMVLSNNLLLLFVFWELTSITSFFLIGFYNDSEASRKSAITALSITGLGGFVLLAGIIIMSQVSGTYSLHELLTTTNIIKEHPFYTLIIALIFIGAFTKSAQFPFHFWLPGAMKAPAPVSAYLHSATMVKAGIFLLARLSPILGGTPEWSYTLMIVGGFTMIYAAVHSLFRVDLKAVLAYSTISALGILVFLIGLGTKEAFIALAVFIVVHALYKASLFLITGIIDHETGTRDLTQLQGLKKLLLPVYIAGILAALSSAGLPFSFGFIGKDLIYEAALNAGSLSSYLIIATVITNTCLVAAGFMAGIKPFAGKLPKQFENVHLPAPSMWIPPLLLGIVGFIFGTFPTLLGNTVITYIVQGISGKPEMIHLKIWHGFNTVLLLSVITLLAGTTVYFINRPSTSKLAFLNKLSNLSPESAYRSLSRMSIGFSRRYSAVMHNGFLRSYIVKIIIFAELLFVYELYKGGPVYINYGKLSPITIYEGATILFLIGSLYLTLTTSSRLTAVIGTSILGYAICLLFVYYSAPDLAITQFTIDTLTVVLFVFVLFNLPPFINFNRGSSKIIVRDICIAASFGVLMSLIAIKVLQVPTDIDTSDFYGRYAYTLAKGKNIVNVILVDFRGMDTMFEIVVLSIAALGVYSLLKLKLKSSEKE